MAESVSKALENIQTKTEENKRHSILDLDTL